MADTFVIKKLSVESQDLDEMLPIVLQLSNVIFTPEPSSKYASLTLWKERIGYPDAVLVYVSPEENPREPFAFLFCHPRRHNPPLQSGASETPHIWLAGVLPNQRNQGFLDRMLCAIDHPSQMTVCTTPDLYPRMWNWLLRRGWTVERQFSSGKIMLSK